MYLHADGRLAGYEDLYEDEYLEGIFGTIWKGIKGVGKVGFGAAKGFVTGGPTGAITGGIRTIIPSRKPPVRTAVAQRLAREQNQARLRALRQKLVRDQAEARRRALIAVKPVPRPAPVAIVPPPRPVAPPPSPYAPRVGQYYAPPPMFMPPPAPAMNQFLIPAALVGAALLFSRK